MRAFIVASLLLMTACSSTTQVERTTTLSELGGKWNLNDSQIIAQKIASSLLSGNWLLQAQRKGKPIVSVGEFRNLSHEIINVEAFTAEIEKKLLTSNEVELIASGSSRSQLRQERTDQEFNATDQTRKESGQELGADYLLIGTINSFVERKGGTQNIQYQIDFDLFDVRNNRKVWTDNVQQAKTIQRARFGL